MDVSVKIKIDDDVPFPRHRGGAPALKFHALETMDVAQSFAVSKDQERSLRGAVQFMQNKHRGRKFTVRSVEGDQVRCWRTD